MQSNRPVKFPPMTRLIKAAAKKAGLAPGSLVYTGSAHAKPYTIKLIRYNQADCSEKPLNNVDEIVQLNKYNGVTWIDTDGVSDVIALENIGKHFNLHPLIVEDILSIEQRPKFLEYENCVFVVLKMISYDERHEKIMTEQLSIIVTDNTVLTFQDGPHDVLEPVRKRIRAGIGRIRKLRADYLAYAIVDAVVDHYLVVMEAIGGKIETLEDSVVHNQSAAIIHKIHTMKREVIYLRRAVWPLREVVQGFRDSSDKLISDDIEMFLHDLDDHILRIIDVIETYRDMLATVLDVYMSSVSLRMNAVMKVLTVISTIFIPLTFIVGVYGMNFDNMPELHWAWGYYGVWAIMLTMITGMFYFFRKKDWI